MSKLSMLIHLIAYNDSSSSNAPSLNNFKWTRNLNGIPSGNAISQEFSLAPGESKTLFDGSRTLSHDGTTHYSLTLKPLSTNTYVLTAISGTLPNFRTPRTTGADATTQVTVTINGPLATFVSTGGTAFNFAGVQVGDYARIGTDFNVLNQGEYKILAKTSTSFTVENEIAVAEGPITMGADFATQIQIYSALGVQKGDTIKITGGFSAVSRNSYQVTDVAANYLEFYSTDALPVESDVQTNAFAIYMNSRQLIYLESNKKVSVTINGTLVAEMEPFVINNSVFPGVFMLKSTVYSLSVTNTDTDTASMFLAAAD